MNTDTSGTKHAHFRNDFSFQKIDIHWLGVSETAFGRGCEPLNKSESEKVAKEADSDVLTEKNNIIRDCFL